MRCDLQFVAVSWLLVLLLASPVFCYTPEEQALLSTIRDTRAQILQTTPSGRGLATIDATDQLPGMANVPPAGPPRKAEFVFAGPTTLVKEYDRRKDNELLGSALVKDAKQVFYLTGATGVPSSVRIDSIPSNAGFTPQPKDWSFRTLSRLPVPVEEARFWSLVEKDPNRVSVTRTGSTVTLRRVTPIAANMRDRVISEETELDFDMAHGAMLSRYCYRTVRAQNGVQEELAEKLSISWIEQDGHMVPTDWVGQTILHIDGKLRQESTGKVHFERFSVENVDPKELSVEQMGIKPGTPVVNMILGTQFPYAPAPGQDIVAELMEGKAAEGGAQAKPRVPTSVPVDSAQRPLPQPQTAVAADTNRQYHSKANYLPYAAVGTLLIAAAIVISARKRRVR